MRAVLPDSYDLLELFKLQTFPEQTEFVTNNSRFKAVLCPRRAAKSRSIVYRAFYLAAKYPKSKILLTGITLQSARESFEDQIEDIIASIPFNQVLDIKKKGSPLSWTFHNGSVIRIMGAESAGISRIGKFRGTKYRMVAIDEPQDFNNVLLRSLINEVFRPALRDLKGELCLAGTPGHGETYWYQIAAAPEPNTQDAIEWQRFSWNVLCNPHVAEQTRQEIAEITRMFPEYLDTNEYQREWLGQWAVDTSNIIFTMYDYNLSPGKSWKSLPKHDYTTLLGIDLGFDDATAFVIVRYSQTDPTLYVIHCEQHTQLLLDDIIDKTKWLIQSYNIDAWVADGSKIDVESMKYKLDHCPNVPNPKMKTLKSTVQMTIVSELARGKILFEPEPYEVFTEEWKHIIWDPVKRKEGELQEKEGGCDNHLSDALRYVYQVAKHYKGEAPHVDNNMKNISKQEQALIRINDRQDKHSHWGDYTTAQDLFDT